MSLMSEMKMRLPMSMWSCRKCGC